jgi:predicted PurR-regulated permease PerM
MILEKIGGYFLIVCLLGALYFSYIIIKPYLAVIFLAIVIVAIFYPLYKWVRKKVKGNEYIASSIMVVFILLLLFVPVFIFVMVLEKKVTDVYILLQDYNKNNVYQLDFLEDKFNEYRNWIINNLGIRQLEIVDFKTLVNMSVEKVQDYVIASSTGIIKETSQFIVNFIVLFLTLFYLFKDGEKAALKVMRLTPLSNKYDRRLYIKFRDVSISSVVSTLVIAIMQGIAFGIGSALLGLPAFFLGAAAMFCSLIPLVGSSIVWVPTGIFLLLLGQPFNAFLVFILGFGVSSIDNVARPFLMKGRTEIHTLLLFFSIIGGLAVFGFFGIIYGPLILSTFLTLLYIYELEYDPLLEK